jgi:acetolactate synthase-1/2/3 large subunit
MHALLGGHAVAQTLREAGCDCIFTLCGGHVAPIYDGCVELGIAVVDTRHEQAAVHAADACARLRRQVGVAVLTAGPGVTDGITGIANASFANSPVLVIAGAPALEVMGRGALQEMDQGALVQGITKGRFTVVQPDRIAETVAQAIQLSLSGVPGPVFVEIPFDVLASDTQVLRTHQARFRPLRQPVDAPQVDELMDLVRASQRPVLFAGSSVWWDDAAAEVARLGAAGFPVYGNGMGRGVLPPEHEAAFFLSRAHALARCDLLLLVGAPLDFRIDYGRGIAAEASIVQVDRDPRSMGRNRAVDLALHADARSVLGALAHAVEAERFSPARFAGWTAELRHKEQERRERQLAWERADGAPVNHFRLARAIADAADEDTIIVGDGGDCVTMAAKVIQPRKPGRWLDPEPFGTLGVGAPFALAAKWLRRSSQVIVLSGDGAFGLTGFDFETCVRFGLPVTVVVANDAAWGQIRVPQVERYGEERAVGSQLAPIRYDRIVADFGGQGEHVDTGPELDAALRRARASGTVYAIDVNLDRDFISKHRLSRFTVK